MLPSFGTITSIIAQILISICISFIYVFFISVILPAVFLKPRYNESAEGDRGLKKYVFEGGRAIVYEPSVDVKRYIKQYILTAIGQEKYIQCKFDTHVFSSRYDVFAFDCDDRMIDAIHVEEPDLDEKRGVSHPALLPMETAYVKVSVASVNEVKIEREPLMSISSLGSAQFTVFTVLATIAEAFIVKSVLLDVSETALSYVSAMKDYGNLFTLISAVFAGLLLSFFGKLLHGLTRREKEDIKMQSKKKIRK